MLRTKLYAGKVVVPKRGTETFISAIGHLDGRIDLLKTDRLFEGDSVTSALLEDRNKALMDLCILSSKLAYENACLVKSVVDNHWKVRPS